MQSTGDMNGDSLGGSPEPESAFVTQHQSIDSTQKAKL
jgi:hypothetical protein